MRFSPPVTHRLTQAGWYEGRRLNISPLVAYLKEEGFEFPCPPMEEFLMEFGNLYIVTPKAERVYPINMIFYSDEAEEVYFRQFHFDILELGDELFELIEARYVPIVGHPLYPIGGWSQDLLLMGINGQVYNAFDEIFELVAETGYGAIEKMVKESFQE